MLDVIIVGGSIAGLMAGRQLEKNRLSYFIIEKKPRIGKPLCCGEGVRASVFLRYFNPKPEFVLHRISKQVIRIGNQERVFNFSYYQLNRPKFEHFLAKPLSKNIHLKEEVLAIKQERKSVIVLTNKRSYCSRFVILANGANYGIQKQLGMLTTKPEFLYCSGGLFNTRQKKLAYNVLCFPGNKPVVYWRFPRGKFSNAGCCVYAKGYNPLEYLNKINSFFPELRENKIGFTGIVPAFGIINRTVSHRVVACGDAAGLTFAILGEGIPFALLSGFYAAFACIKSLKSNKLSELNKYDTYLRQNLAYVLAVGLLAFKARKWFGSDQKQAQKLLQRIPLSLIKKGAKTGQHSLGRQLIAYYLLLPGWAKETIAFAFGNITKVL